MEETAEKEMRKSRTLKQVEQSPSFIYNILNHNGKIITYNKWPFIQ